MTYAHRNGVMEPPTINGWYGFDGEHRNAVFAGKLIERGVYSQGFFLVDGDKYERIVWDGERCQSIDDFHGLWWGPVTPPWEPQPDTTGTPRDDESDSVLNGRVADLLQALQDRGEL